MIGPTNLSKLSNRQKDQFIEKILSLGAETADGFSKQASGQPVVGDVEAKSAKFDLLWEGPNNLKRTAFAIN